MINPKIQGLTAIITSRVSGFIQGLKQATHSTRDLQQAWGRAARDINTAANRVTLAVGGMVAGAVVQFSKFESTMTRAGAVTNTLGTRDFAQLRDEALKMGATTVYSATDAAEAIEKMGLAGLKTNEIIAALPGTLRLAAAAQISIADASDYASKTMRAFGADATELDHIIDVGVATFTRSNTDLMQLGEAMKHVAPVSSALGVSIEDTSAAIAKMGDAGFQGSMAGTALRNILSRLAGAAPEITSKFKEVGLQTLDASGKMRPFLELLEDIEQLGLSDAKILELFGARGGPQLLALLGVGTAALRDFSAELEKSGGVAQRISEAQLGTLWGTFKLIQSQLESVLLEVGHLAPELKAAGAEFVALIEQLKPQFVSLAQDGLRMVLMGARELIAYLADNGDKLLEFAGAMGSMLAPLARLLIEFPQLTAVLIALKVTGILGVNQAVISLTIALWKSAAALFAWKTKALVAQGVAATFAPKLAAVQVASTALKLSLLGLAVAIGTYLGVKLAQLMPSMQQFQREMKRTIDLSNELQKIWDRRYTKTLDDLFKKHRDDNDGLLKELAALRKQAEADLSGAIASMNGARKKIDQLDTTLKSSFGNKLLEVAEREFTEAKDRADQIRGWIERLNETFADVEAKVASATAGPQPEAEVPFDRIGDASGMDAGFGAGVDGESVDELIRSRLDARRDAETPGFSELRDVLLRPDVTAEQVRAFAETLDNATPELVRNLVDAFRSIDQERLAGDAGAVRDPARLEQLAGTFANAAARQGEFGQRRDMVDDAGRAMVGQFQDLRGVLSPEQLEPFAEAFLKLREQFLTGRIDAEQFQTSLTGLNDQLRMASTSADAMRGFSEHIGDSIEQISTEFGDTFAAEVSQNMAPFRDQAASLAQQFETGAISLFQFQQGMQALKQTTDEATQAAIRKEQQERRAALLRGDFAGAGLNLQQAIKQKIEDFLIQQRMQQFQNAVGQAAAGFLGLSNSASGLTDQFSGLSGGLQDFGQQLRGTFGDNGQAGQAFDALSQFLASNQGQIDALYNNIQLLQQKLGVLDEYSQRKAVLDEIAGMEARLSDLLTMPAPVLTPSRDPYADPGVSRNAIVNLTLPNVTRISTAEADMLANRVADSVGRRGNFVG